MSASELSGRYLSWGRYHRCLHRIRRPFTISGAHAAMMESGPVLPYGMGRSYGDTCLNDGGTLIDTTALDRWVQLDTTNGVLICEAGVTLADILTLLARASRKEISWFLPVTPGTKFVTVGGAIANDVHGKNHHRMGTFGRHVLWFDLARSDGSLVRCSPRENVELYHATIGGLGLTGLITSAAIQLNRVPGWVLEVEDIQMGGLDEFYALAAESVTSWDYTAAWIDCLAGGAALGRGIFTRARHGEGELPTVNAQQGRTRLSVPVDAPASLLNGLTLRAFNALYYRKMGSRKRLTSRRGYEQVLYPLDAIGNWNRLYGKRGFLQYQCVVPVRTAPEAIAEMLQRISAARQGSFLVVLKTFGDVASPGLLSFPMEGTTLALDFPARGESTLHLLDILDEVTQRAGGRVYPAKDGRMSAARFHQFYPAVERFRASVDPNVSSTFWRRVHGTGRLPS